MWAYACLLKCYGGLKVLAVTLAAPFSFYYGRSGATMYAAWRVVHYIYVAFPRLLQSYFAYFFS